MENFQLPHYYPLSNLLHRVFRTVENCSWRQTHIGWLCPPRNEYTEMIYTTTKLSHHPHTLQKTKAWICFAMRIVNIISTVLWAFEWCCWCAVGIDRKSIEVDMNRSMWYRVTLYCDTETWWYISLSSNTSNEPNFRMPIMLAYTIARKYGEYISISMHTCDMIGTTVWATPQFAYGKCFANICHISFWHNTIRYTYFLVFGNVRRLCTHMSRYMHMSSQISY